MEKAVIYDQEFIINNAYLSTKMQKDGKNPDGTDKWKKNDKGEQAVTLEIVEFGELKKVKVAIDTLEKLGMDVKVDLFKLKGKVLVVNKAILLQ